MSVTMRGISRFFAETLNENAEFIALSDSLISDEFNYFMNVDLATVEVPLPYFGIVTFNDKDDREVEKKFQTQFLIGIEREKPDLLNGVMEEPTLDKLEQLSRKAYEIITNEMRFFGIQGDKNVRVSYVNMYVPNPDGDDDLQMQIDIEIEQDKYISCN
jgi:hypothetical protein